MSVSSFKELLPQEVLKRLNGKEDIRLLDVREPEEWESGHIAGAKHIPLGYLPERLHELEPGKEIIVICRSGNRSRKACEYLSAAGHKVVNMSGGLNEWPGNLEAGK